MARPKSLVPTYRKHKPSNTARCWAQGRWISLGRWNSPESKAEFARIVAELTASPSARVGPASAASVNQVLAAFWQHAEQHYRRADGSPSDELSHFRQTFKVARKLYGHIAAKDFGPLALKAIRQTWIEAGWSRKVINQRVGRIRRAFKWAASEQLIPAGVYQSLTTVTGLQAGRTNARETEPVEPVAESVVEATLPFLNRHVRGLIELQRLTGCRPGEACTIRRSEIDTGGAIWLYRPTHHKTAHRGKARVIAIGPKAQVVLREFFTPAIDAYLFSPRRAVEEIRDECIAKDVRKPRPATVEHYDAISYGHAIARACELAFPLPPAIARLEDESLKQWRTRLTPEQTAEVKMWRKGHGWHPNQLRHGYATRIRKAHGLEAAQVVLGHSKADVTQIYAERNLDLAVKVAAAVG